MANKILAVPETAISWRSSGGTAALTLTSKATGAGQVGAQVDRGSGAKSRRVIVEGGFKTVASPTLGAVISVLFSFAQEDATKPDGDVGQADAALSALDKRRNLTVGLAVEIDVVGTSLMKGTTEIDWPAARYVSAVVINEAGVALSATATDHYVVVTPVPDEVQ